MTVGRLLLDLDGPILDVRARYWAVHREIVAQLGLPLALDETGFWEAKRVRQPLPALLGVADDDAALPLYRQAWAERIERADALALDRLQPDAATALAAIPASVHTVLVSLRTNTCAAGATLKRLDIRRFFDGVVWVPHAEGGKTAAYRRALGPAQPSETLAIGDTEVDLRAARACAIPFVAVANGIRTPAELHSLGADVVVADLTAALAGRWSGEPAR